MFTKIPFQYTWYRPPPLVILQVIGLGSIDRITVDNLCLTFVLTRIIFEEEEGSQFPSETNQVFSGVVYVATVYRGNKRSSSNPKTVVVRGRD